MADPLHRHHSSLEGVIFLVSEPLKPDDYNKACGLFNSIITEFEPLQTTENGYKCITLIRLMKEEVSDKDNFLRLFLLFVENVLHGGTGEIELSFSHIISSLSNFATWTIDENEKVALGKSLVKFAKYLVDNFFLPRMLPGTRFKKHVILTLLSKSISCKDATVYPGISFASSGTRYWYPTTCL